ncbi:MAG: hypothetical protein ACRDYD_12585, partial [Acidimicrobiales bacterium]
MTLDTSDTIVRASAGVHRGRRRGGIAVALATLVVGTIAGIGASGGSASADPIAAKQAQAAAVASRIQTLGQRLDAQDEQYNQAVVHEHSVEAQVTASQARLAQDQANVASLEGHLRQEAVVDFMNQGSGGELTGLLQGSAATLGLRQGFLSAVANAQQDVVDNLHIARRQLQAQQAQLVVQESKARDAVAAVAADRAATASAAQAQRQLLSQVKGQLAKLVAARQAAQQAAQAAIERARLAAQQQAQQAQQAAAQQVAGSSGSPPVAGPAQG